MTHPNPHLAYRGDIDGLRAIAVLSVVIYHIFPAALPGGFVGVDIFFVISGYLISLIIFKSMKSGEFSFLDFYARRVRRIFPTLLLVILSCLVAAWFSLLPHEYAQLAKHALGGLGFSANILYWLEAGYFDAEASLKPLLHLWSLGVEEQFYIIWPLVIVALWPRGRWLPRTLLVVTFASLLLSLIWVGSHPTEAFFLLPGRAWELLVGAGIAWHVARHGPILLSPRLHTGLSVLGLMLIALSVLLIDKTTPFPGLGALPPVLGAACLILAGERSILNRMLLANRFMVGMGLISFALYLWHWPLISWLHILRNQGPTLMTGLGILTLSIVLAWLSYRFIERPIRSHGKTRTTLALLIISALLAALSFNIYSRDGLKMRLKNAQSKQDAAVLDWPPELRYAPSCMEKYGALFQGQCITYDDKRQVDAAIIGDSHANHYFWGIGKVLSEHGINLIQLARGGCAPLRHVAIQRNPQNITCDETLEEALALIAGNPQISTVFLAGRWGDQYLGYELKEKPIERDDERLIYGTTQPGPAGNRQEVFLSGLEQTIQFLTQAGKTIVFLHTVPELSFNARECVSWTPNRFVSRNSRTNCEMSREELRARESKFRPAFETLLARYPQVRVFDPIPYFCDESRCLARRDGQLLYRDDDHLSLAGSHWLAQQAAGAFNELTSRP